MERVTSILISILIALLVYLFFELILKKEEARSFFRRQWWLHPNSICLWRVILGVSGTLLYFLCGLYFLGILLFSISAILDGVDGLVARSCNLATPSGEEIDPLCDKITYLPPMIFFAYEGQLDIMIIWVLVSIEFCGQFIIRALIKRYTSFSVGANNFGKIKAVLCFSLIIYCAVLSDPISLPNFTSQVLNLCVILSIASIIFKLIPNRFYADILSILNLFCGIGGIILILQGRYVQAALAILAGQIFDLFDGRMAEKHGGTKIGPYLDDIADLFSFGLCPGLLILAQGHLGLPYIVLGIIYSLSVGFRLYRFLAYDKHDKTLPEGVFNGLPSPAGAMVALGASLFWEDWRITLAVILFTSFLLVSRIRFVHFRRIVFHRLPRTVVVLLGFAVVFTIAYLIKEKNPHLLGAALLVFFSLYVIFCNHKVFRRFLP
jgi:CDP-diacylglycerol--serine O-phosphatidyltransferase